MRNMWKKICSFVFVLAMAAALIPASKAMAAENYGDVSIYLNDGTEAVATVSGDWIMQNLEGPQIYSVASKSKNGKASYVIADGVSFEKVLQEAKIVSEGIEGELDGASFGFLDAESTKAKNPISYDYLIRANKVMTPGGEEGTDTRTDTGKTVTPILAVSYSDSYASYEEAEAAMAGEWKNTLEGYRFVTGMSGDTYTYGEDKALDSNSIDLNLKYSIANVKSIQIKTAKLTSFVLDQNALTVKGAAGATGQLKAVAEPASALVGANVSWTSSDEKIASVDANGTVTAVSYGKCTVTAAVEGTELKASCEVSVVPSDLEICVNDQKKVTIDGEWMLANMDSEPQIYSVSNQKINGKVKYLIAQGVNLEVLLQKAGIITDSLEELDGSSVAFSDGGFEREISYEQLMNGNKVMAGGISQVDGVWEDTRTELGDTVSPILAIYYSGQYADYSEAQAAVQAGGWESADNTYCFTSGMSGEKYSWSDREAGNVDQNSVDLNLKYQVKKTIKVTVKVSAAEAIALNKSALTFNSSKAQKLTASITPAPAALVSTVAWKSSDTKVAKVSKDGTVTPVALGSCKVTASVTTADGKVLTASAKITVNYPAAVTKLAVKNVSGKKAQVSWKKVSKANGYVVYRATKANGTYKKVKTITSGKTVKFTDSKLKKGQKYYYKVRAYRTVSGKKVYGAYSSVKKVTIKK